MPLSIELEVRDAEARRAMAKLAVSAPEALRKVLTKFVFRVERSAKKEIQHGSKSGRIYKLRGGGTHQASKRGEAPATRTGRLVSSIRSSVKDEVAIVGTPVAYALKLETVLGRGFIGPASEKAEEFVTTELIEALKNANL